MRDLVLQFGEEEARQERGMSGSVGDMASWNEVPEEGEGLRRRNRSEEEVNELKWKQMQS